MITDLIEHTPAPELYCTEVWVGVTDATGFCIFIPCPSLLVAGLVERLADEGWRKFMEVWS